MRHLARTAGGWLFTWFLCAAVLSFAWLFAVYSWYGWHPTDQQLRATYDLVLPYLSIAAFVASLVLYYLYRKLAGTLFRR